MRPALPALSAVWSVLAAADVFAQPVDDLGRWHAGAYSYSDELGGFKIVGIAGTGTADDPVVLSQEMLSASPAVVVIRAEKEIRPYATTGTFANGIIHIRIITLNNSGLPWIEFEFELQERQGEPSTFGDGLSFDQRRLEGAKISSDRFPSYHRDYEPFDRLIFKEGHTNPLESVQFDFLITDFTPRGEFFLVQDPTVPVS